MPGNSFSSDEQWLALAALTCNWLEKTVNVCPLRGIPWDMYIGHILISIFDRFHNYFMVCELFTKYQFGAIHTAAYSIRLCDESGPLFRRIRATTPNPIYSADYTRPYTY